ncbi:MAG: RNA 3'-terminal phosphate cyclase [Myxococcales bacterium]|nr:RNA 3'-terminal phosphate cyclase [Myxococcales bacterium]
MSSYLRVDGSMGEGGGQVLRTSLSLAAVRAQPLEIDGIRAGRKRPGLLRQHRTAARAVAEICEAELEGAELGSRRLRLRPGRPRAGEYHFAVGSAGSVCLVLQTVLPILLHADGPSELLLEGGTHNPAAPTFEYLDRVFFPILRRMGVGIRAELDRAGFYPAGGGKVRVHIEPATQLLPLALLERGSLRRVEARAIFSKIPSHVATRELDRLRERLAGACLGEAEVDLRPHQLRSPGPGNVVSILLEADVPELVTSFGRRGLAAEAVAEEALAQALRHLDSDAPVGEHLADQLLLPLALGAGGAFRTGPLSRHARTSIELLRQLLPERRIEVSPLERGVLRVEIGEAD